jgi:hypothetical protein
MRHLLLSVGLALALVLSSVAQARTITDNEARSVAFALVNALAANDIGAALRISSLPFLAEDRRLLATSEDFAVYFREALAIARPGAFPEQIVSIRDYWGTRSHLHADKLRIRDNVLRAGDVLVIMRHADEYGVVMVGDRDGKTVVLGFGSCEGDSLC